ncbi:restriction endonuclease subunit S [Nitrosomonas sp.]|uniref:restriction endonuclease subunit S n=1 Tax=Nitrosomonas sp. TaxID=42353 RepID=UPI00262EB30F|nr:restriction endonuclease subunit S [Nitrosomonas sp.]MCW5600278.1 restriction endonuclease subunit S [Nitrosomonas sp.]
MKLNNNDLQSFEELPQGWTVTTLGEILPLTYGKALKKENRDKSGNVPVYGSSGQVGVHSNALTKKPALIVGRKGSVGEVYRSPAPCWPIDTVYFTEERDDGDLKYFEYLLKGLKLSKLDKSTAVPGLSRDDYNAVEVVVAPLDQQKRIVAEIEKQFSHLDEAVANLKRVKANLKRYKAAVLKAAVEGRLVETKAELTRRANVEAASRRLHQRQDAADTYETDEQLLQRILETRRRQWKGKGKYREPAAPDTTDLPELPEGWVWASPEQLSAGKQYSLAIGPFGSRLKVSDYTGTGVPLVFVRNIRTKSFGDSDTVFVSEEKADELRAHQVEAGGLLVTKMGDPPGDVCIYPANRPTAIITADCIKLRLSSNLPPQ